eukprot:gene3777-13843_t
MMLGLTVFALALLCLLNSAQAAFPDEGRAIFNCTALMFDKQNFNGDVFGFGSGAFGWNGDKALVTMSDFRKVGPVPAETQTEEKD